MKQNVAASGAPQRQPKNVRTTTRVVKTTSGIIMRENDFAADLRQGHTLVYFSKIDCPSCVKQDPLWEDAVAALPPRIKSAKVFPYLVSAKDYGVKSYPSFILFKDGAAVRHLRGVTATKRLLWLASTEK